jgi:hypothetical protein
MNIRDSEMQAFRHPLNSAIIQYAPDYDQRKNICSKLFDLYLYDCFTFRNQSINRIVQNLFFVTQGKIPTSYHIQEDDQIFEDYSTKPMINTFFEIYPETKTCKGFDIVKSYSNAAINMEYDYPVYNITDILQKY